MMQSALVDALRQAAVATFEQVVFLLPDTPPDEGQRAQPVAAVASIAFAGPARGVLQVRASRGLLPRLAANMLGQELDSEALQLDALGEIANIICGQVFPHLDTFRAFEQQPPIVARCTDPLRNDVPGTGEPTAQIELGLETSRADVLLWLFRTAA
jgi:CheY-specific phosphatase CheX